MSAFMSIGVFFTDYLPCT